MTYKIVCGIIDLTFFLGDKNPETPVKMYHTYLKGFTLPPFWAMGFHTGPSLKHYMVRYR
jgi:hypothetical protein